MNNKTLYVIIVLLLAIIIGGGTYFFLNREGVTITNTGSQPPVANENAPVSANITLSEQPNKTKYDEYLSDIYLGKMAIGKTIGTDGFPTATNIFTNGTDQFCTMMTLKKAVISGKTAVAIYDTVTKQDNQPKTVFPRELKVGGNGGCGDLTQLPGKYEYKLYFDDVLVAVLPFEVK